MWRIKTESRETRCTRNGEQRVEYRFTIFAPLSFQVAIRDCNRLRDASERRKVGLYLYFRPIFYSCHRSYLISTNPLVCTVFRCVAVFSFFVPYFLYSSPCIRCYLKSWNNFHQRNDTLQNYSIWNQIGKQEWKDIYAKV